MQYTPNYNLITVEGTDVVNPLVQMNPNFTDIDAAMFANKKAVIGSATEITSGTVHSITRLNPDSNYFRFTATSNWNAGDSFSVDGVAVSAFTPDGRTLAQGCYVINSEVFAILNGTRLTVYVDRTFALSDITDTDINSPADDEALVYENGSWSNKRLKSSDITYSNGTVKEALDNLKGLTLVEETPSIAENGQYTIHMTNIPVNRIAEFIFMISFTGAFQYCSIHTFPKVSSASVRMYHHINSASEGTLQYFYNGSTDIQLANQINEPIKVRFYVRYV